MKEDVVERCVQEVARLVRSRRSVSCIDLIRELASRGFSPGVVLRALVVAEERGLVRFVERFPGSVIDYLLSPLVLDFWFVLVIVVVTVILVLGLRVTEPPLVYVRYVVGSIFVLFVPGFSLIQCLYPLREELSDLERLALSIGLSLALVPLVGLILNYTPFGIRLEPVTVSLALLSVGLISGAVVRRYLYLSRARGGV